MEDDGGDDASAGCGFYYCADLAEENVEVGFEGWAVGFGVDLPLVSRCVRGFSMRQAYGELGADVLVVGCTSCRVPDFVVGDDGAGEVP